MEYGYIRVSTREQNEERQIIALREYGILPEHIYMDKQSGKDFNRRNYQKMVRTVKNGDLIVVKSIDRLGRNYEEILEQWRILTKEKHADICVLDFPLLDTRSRAGEADLTGRLVSDLVLQILAYVAQKEREFIRQRQAEGIAAAKARQVRFGRRPIPVPENYEQLRLRWTAGEISAREAAAELGISHTTFLNWAKQKKC